MLNQIDNFYEISNLNFKHKKYRLGDDVVLNKNNLMTGFKFDFDYLKIISEEGKICGDYAKIETKHGVRWAVSTWKFANKIKLKDYIKQYSGMTVVYNGKYEITTRRRLRRSRGDSTRNGH
jgi:transcription elongation factor